MPDHRSEIAVQFIDAGEVDERETGYKIVHIKMRYGQATGKYEDFVTGFVGGPGVTCGAAPSAPRIHP